MGHEFGRNADVTLLPYNGSARALYIDSLVHFVDASPKQQRETAKNSGFRGKRDEPRR